MAELCYIFRQGIEKPGQCELRSANSDRAPPAASGRSSSLEAFKGGNGGRQGQRLRRPGPDQLLREPLRQPGAHRAEAQGPGVRGEAREPGGQEPAAAVLQPRPRQGPRPPRRGQARVRVARHPRVHRRGLPRRRWAAAPRRPLRPRARPLLGLLHRHQAAGVRGARVAVAQGRGGGGGGEEGPGGGAEDAGGGAGRQALLRRGRARVRGRRAGAVRAVVPDLREARRVQRRRRVPGARGVGGALRPGERVRGQVAAGARARVPVRVRHEEDARPRLGPRHGRSPLVVGGAGKSLAAIRREWIGRCLAFGPRGARLCTVGCMIHDLVTNFSMLGYCYACRFVILYF